METIVANHLWSNLEVVVHLREVAHTAIVTRVYLLSQTCADVNVKFKAKLVLLFVALII